MLLLLAWLQHQGWQGGGTTERPAPKASPRTSPRASSAYAPQGPEASQALPGGSLEAHEGRGGHTLERHVGRTAAQLKARLQAEDKREVSTFPDLATAERLVARALFERRREVSDWLGAGARGDTSVTWRAAEVAGLVLRDGAERPVPGHTVHVVIYSSDRFPEGFAVRTAYVRLP